MASTDRPRFRVDAERHAASRRVRYVETNHPDDGSCTLCRLDQEPAVAADTRPRMNPTPEHDDEQDDETFAEARLIEAVENQLAAGEPAAAQATLNKLTLVGYPREESIELMALALAHEIRAMLREDRPFDLAGYEALLRALPDLPEEEADEADQ